MRGRKVAVIGGGVAGLTAAHELAERGFSVTLYEQRGALGGKSRSYPRQGPVPGAGKPPPAEHGFRFFPGFYRHVPDTLKRIPFRGVNARVYDNLVPTEANLIASYTRDPVAAVASYPKTLDALREGIRFVPGLMDLGLSNDDLTFYFHKLWRVLTSSRERRLAELESQSWREFMEPEGRSHSYDDYLVTNTTRTLLAARAEDANALTIAEISLQLWATLLWYPQRGGDRILNGPSSERWIEPWRAYLETLGVELKLNHRLHAIWTKEGRVSRVVFRDTAGRTPADEARLKEARARNYREAFEELTLRLEGADAGQRRRLEREARATLQDIALETERDFYASFPAVEGIDADYYVFALPVEHMAKFLTEELLSLDPRLRGIAELTRHVRWMGGIQIYLNEAVDIGRGHVSYAGSPWALTSIVQSELWSEDIDLKDYADGSVRAILSVCISEWKTPGFNGKEAGDCPPQELALEVWEQVKRALNRPNKPPVLRDSMLALGGDEALPGWHRASPAWFALDEGLTDRLDAIRDAPIPDAWEAAFRNWIDRDEAGEADFYFNAEPLFVNIAGSWQHRPEVASRIPNLLLVGDYVQTHTNLACMEAANEAGRRATNEILRRAGANAEPCELWELDLPFEALRSIDQRRFRAGKPWRDLGGGHIDLISNAGKAGLHAFKALRAIWKSSSKGR